MPPFSLLFLLFPLLELVLLVLAGRAFGGLAVLLWILFTGAVGLAVLQRAGWRRGGMSAGVSPAAQLADGMMLGSAGFLLFLPGLITDALGLLLLLPITRRCVAGLFGRLVSSRWAGFVMAGRSAGADGRGPHDPRTGHGVTLEGEYWREEGGSARPEDRRLP